MPNTIIKASAGSGKTFRLSNQFLDIVLRPEGQTSEKVSSILASTFTRKAAGEILDRILTRLAEAALDEKKQHELAKHVQHPDTINTERLQKITAEIAKNLYRLRICTLDSFFNKIASAFALELGLPPGWSIIDETEYQRSIHEAVREVFDESQKNEARKLLHLFQKGEEDRNVTQELISTAKDLLPLVRSTSADLWDHTDSHKLGQLTLGKMTEEAIQQHLEPVLNDPQLRLSLLPLNKATSKSQPAELNKPFKKAFDEFINSFQERDWQKILLKGFGNKIILGERTFSSKPIEPPLLDFMTPLVWHAVAIELEIIINQTKATRALLDLVWKKLEFILQQKRGFRFEDITFCLGDLFRRKPNALPQRSLSHRIDAPTKHLLLDEFQDTSLPQWSILQPFVQSVVKTDAKKDGQTSFFCVGDLKQAIYGWRGGIAEIFESVSDFLEKEGAESPETPVMNETRRNSEPVIDTVSQIFRHIGTNAAVCDKSPAAAARWQEWFGNEKHKTLSPTKGQGYCVLEAAPAEDTSENSEEEESLDTEKPFWKYTVNRIEELHKKHPNQSIGVLFRSGKHIPTLLKGLKIRGIEASDEGGIPLTDSAAIQHVLSVMTLIDHPGDTIIRFHLANGPLADSLSLPNHADSIAAEKAAHHWRKKILSQGYGKTVKELMSELTPCEPKEMQRLEKLLELAYQFDEKSTGTRTRQFIEAVQAARMANPSAAKVSVMTIHKAKGLEFDIVVLPDLDSPQQLVGRQPKVIVSQDSPTAPVNFVLRWVKDELRTLLPDPYQKAFVRWKDNQVKESLAILYVAMTRARHELVMIVPEKSRNGQGTYAGVLKAGLNITETKPGVLYQIGNEDWDNELAEEIPELPTFAWNPLSKSVSPRNLPRDTPSGREMELAFRHVESTPSMESVSRHDASLRGTAIHACFASIRWWKETDLDVTTLQKIVEESAAKMRNDSDRSEIDSAEVVETFLSMCKQSEVQKVLMRSSYPAEEKIDVETERRFAIRWKDKLLHGSMDRLVIRKIGDEVTGLEIIDFKTDRQGSESTSDFLEERKKIYAPQMEAYRQAAQKLYPNVQQITAKLVFASINKVEEIE
ncbi:MAG: UvrD-helicase domain-containing protein [Planctomycetaceae bacterium]|jgi:ATP-dependent exoDNAse (exonuclease V) beta subunit|nr:UvrD-helicase domain-containing protein [Planctomycetaceae bacterium]